MKKCNYLNFSITTFKYVQILILTNKLSIKDAVYRFNINEKDLQQILHINYSKNPLLKKLFKKTKC